MARLYTNTTQIIRSVLQTIKLDLSTLLLPYWTPNYKFSFLRTKYCVICKYLVKKEFIFGESFAQVKSEKIFYNAPFGLAPFQFVINTHRKNFKKIAIPQRGIIVDIGANVGCFSKLARSIYPDATIHAIEPVEQTYRALQQNFSSDSNTKTHNCAISDTTTTVTMLHDNQHNELSRIDTNGDHQVQATTLDSFTTENNITRIHLLKIDTESHELQILKKATSTLKNTQYLLIEITVNKNNNYTFSELIKELCTDEYNFQLIRLRAVPSSENIEYMDCLFSNILFGS